MRPTAAQRNPHKPVSQQCLRAAIDALEPRRLLAGNLSLNVPSTITVPAGKTIQVPVSVDNGTDISFDADTSSGINAGFRTDANPWLELATSRGTMRFQLFADLAPNTVRKIRGLVDSGFYDGLAFNRVLSDSDGTRLIEGGARGDNAVPLSDDEFNPDAIFDGYGQLAMANPDAKDANGSSFFVTGSTIRKYDFNSTIFGQIVRGQDVLESILDTATDNEYSPASATTIRSAKIISRVDQDAVMQVRGSSKTSNSRSVVVTATDEDGNSVSQTIRVKVVPDGNYTPPILNIDSKYDRIGATAGSIVSIPFDVIDLESQKYEVRANVLSGSVTGGVNSAASSIDYENGRVNIAVNPGVVGQILVQIGVREYNSVYRGSIATRPGDDVSNLRIYDTQIVRISVGGTPVEKITAPAAVTARVGNPDAFKDLQLATFKSDADADANDFSALINWGDGSALDAARIEQVKDGLFAVVVKDGHAYNRAADGIPIDLTINGANGSGATTRITAIVGDPASLTSDGTLSIRGTIGDDRVRFESDDTGKLIVRINDERLSFTQSSVQRIVVELFDGNDELLTLDAVDLPSMTVHGGAGNDSLYGGDAGDLIFGDAGDDQLYGNSGDDTVYGGEGDDSILGGGGKNFIYGEAGDDRVVGGGGRDFISGGEGSDKLYGRNGDDTIEGNAGTDRLYGENGNDRLIGGSSNDRLYGGDGNDSLWGNQGNDTLNGGPGTNYRGDRDDGDTLVDVVDLVA